VNPINENNALDSEHTLYTAMTGGGKTAAVKKLGRVKATDQVAFWDPHNDYRGSFKAREVRTYTTFKAFRQAIAAGRKTSQGFKIALKVDETRKNFLAFCQIIWAYGDGQHPKRFHVVCEENPQVTESVGREKSIFGKLLQVGRKFGFILHVVGQRNTEMSKSVVSATPYKWVGMQEFINDAKRMGESIGKSTEEIMTLGKLEYFLKRPRLFVNDENVTRGKLYF